MHFQINPAFLPFVEMTGRKVMQDVAKAVKKQAQHNVSPGIGPGPHPHVSSHKDTGALKKSIFYRTWEKSGEVGFAVGTDLHYGLYLEMGWHTKSGSFFRYQWLYPALQTAAPLEISVATARYRF